MIKDQMWVVQYNKRNCLEEKRILVTTERLTEVIATITQLYIDWKEGDQIVIKPTEMTYCG
jgi:hypothetical protein